MAGQEFRLPDVGEGLTEAEIVTWRVAVGDPVAVNDPLVEIETAKSLVELPSPFAGTVAALLVPAGTTVPVGTPIITIGESASAAPTDEEPSSVLVGYGPSHGRGRSRRRPPSLPGTRGEPTAPAARASTIGIPVPNGRPRAKPPVRKLAKDRGIDLSTVRGSGRDGVITRDDVLAVGERQPVVVRPRTADDEHIPVRGVRAATAAAMTASAFTAPHVTVFHTVDVTRSVKLVARLRDHEAFSGARVTVMLLAARALCLAAREFPDLNATFSDAEIVRHRHVGLGVATASGRGLLVPAIEDADRLSLPALAGELTRVTELARSGSASPADLSGSTITLTNIGVFGVDSGTPILNPGQSAILCLGAVRRTPAEHKGRVALRWTTQLAMSFDHRIIDGQQGAQAVARIGAILRDPKQELLLA